VALGQNITDPAVRSWDHKGEEVKQRQAACIRGAELVCAENARVLERVALIIGAALLTSGLEGSKKHTSNQRAPIIQRETWGLTYVLTTIKGVQVILQTWEPLYCVCKIMICCFETVKLYIYIYLYIYSVYIYIYIYIEKESVYIHMLCF
jgi:hypothetical protein